MKKLIFLSLFVLMLGINQSFIHSQTSHLVVLSGFTFTDANITISVGDTVIWRNDEGFHNVEADDGSFSSGDHAQAPWTFKHVFTAKGVNPYFCIVHVGLGMTGVVTVMDIIPVELLSLSASVLVNDVILSWSTATEINNQMFEIERRNKEGQFITIGNVEGYGTTTEPQEYSYIDNTVGTGIYYYRLKQIDFNGTYEYSGEIEVEVNGPLTFVLEQNYPNPFNPSTLIKYSVPENGFVKLSVYNLVGEEVNLLVSGQVDAGFYEIEFDATALASGIYFYRLQAGNFVETKKMVLMK